MNPLISFCTSFRLYYVHSFSIKKIEKIFICDFISQWQYRMHPEICKFPSLHFYESKLLNGSHMPSKSAPFHQTKCLGPYVFYDIIDGQELHGKNSGALSLYNEHEADAVVEVLRFFRKRY